MNRLALLLIMGLGFFTMTSCVTNEYYNVEPDEPQVGYQYLFDDNFDYDAHNWSFNDPGNSAYVSVRNGVLKYTYLPANTGTNTVAINTGASVYRDFLIQTSIRSDYAMGLVFGVSNAHYGYSIFIDNDGYFAVFDEGGANIPVETIIDWKYSNAINKGGWNDIEFEQAGNYWYGYINGVKVFELPAKYLDGSKIGYIVLDGTTGYADYLTVKW